MRIIFDVLHPAHFLFYKNIIRILERRGHKTLITARKKDVTLKLIKKEGMRCKILSKEKSKSLFGIAAETFERETRLLATAIRFKPDILTGLHNPFVAHVAFLLRKRSVVFSDTEHQKLMSKITFPFASKVCVGTSFKGKDRRNWIRYNGYHELPYLDPKYFKPDAKVIRAVGLKPKDYIFLRLISWHAHHDRGEEGIKDPISLVKELSRIKRVIINAETSVPAELMGHLIKVSPEKIHHVQHFSSLYIGEGATMASEAAVLGTPSIYINSLRLGYIDELEERYRMIKQFNKGFRQRDILRAARRMLKTRPSVWKSRSRKIWKEKIDMNEFLLALFTKVNSGCEGSL